MIVNDNLNISETRFMTSKNSNLEKRRASENAENRLKWIESTLREKYNCYVLRITDNELKKVEKDLGQKVRKRTAIIVDEGFVLEI